MLHEPVGEQAVIWRVAVAANPDSRPGTMEPLQCERGKRLAFVFLPLGSELLVLVPHESETMIFGDNM